MQERFSKFQIATAIAILFHTIGLIGLFYFDKNFFLQATSFNLLLSFALLVWTQPQKNVQFLFFIISCIVVGLAVEIIGVHTAWLFGNYHYGNVLGYQYKNVPLIIGVNWFIIIYCSGISIHTFMEKLIKKTKSEITPKSTRLKFLAVIFDGATLAVFFDWLMEPVAVKLGYWTWAGDGSIPFYNYLCWFLVSVLLLTLFQMAKFNKQNKFAVNLILIQLMFFLLLRTFLN